MGPDDLVASSVYQPAPTAVAAARRFVRGTLEAWAVTGAAVGGDGLVDDAVLLTSELVTNAVVHAGTPVQVTCRLSGGAVEVVVSDDHPARLVPEIADDEHGPAERTGGRGLLMPTALASAWGVAYGRSSKAVWFRLGLDGRATPAGAAAGGPGAENDPTGELADAIGVTAALATALRAARPKVSAADADASQAAPAPLVAASPAGGPGYQAMLSGIVASARVTVAADAAFALMADEDGDLRLRAAVGSIAEVDGTSTRRVPSLVTVPFVVDGRVTGLLAAASQAPGRFGDPEAARLQRLADRSGPALQRAWLEELDRTRRERIGALTPMRGLLAGGLSGEEIMTLAGEAAVPRLAPWCAVLMPAADADLRACHVRHVDAPLSAALGWLVGRACQLAPPDLSGGQETAARRWPLAAAGRDGAPPGVDELAANTAWCFRFAVADGMTGALVIGDSGQDRLSRDVAALATDLACRVGLALDSAPLVGPKA